MYLRHLLRRRHLLLIPYLPTIAATTVTTTATPAFFSFHNLPKPKLYHSTRPLSTTTAKTAVESDGDEDTAAMNEFISRFAHSMRSKLTDAYPTCDKHTIDSMLILVVDKFIAQMNNNGGSFENISPVDEFDNEDLTKTMWEVSNTVFQEMEKEKRKKKLNYHLNSEEVKTMTRFATEIGIRGDMLREMRFKWAKERMEDFEFYSELKERIKEAKNAENADIKGENTENADAENDRKEGLPKRKGKINFKLYGLDLSGEKWEEVAEKVQVVEELIWPSEAKPITGKCKLVTEKILGLGSDYEEGYVSELLKEWIELLEPTRVDWVALLDNLKARDFAVYLKMAEHLLDEPTFQPDIRDYSLLIDTHAKENRTDDVERLLKKMSEKGLTPDVSISTILVHLYSRANNLDQAIKTYEALTSQGFVPDKKMYNSMVMAYVNAGKIKKAEARIKEMEARGIDISEDIYMSLLQAFANRGDLSGAHKTVTTMQFAGFQPSAKSCALLIKACVKHNKTDEARKNFDNMMKLGFRPDDESTSMLISAYERRNELDKALNLLVQLEKDGFEPGMSTYCVLVDWLGKLQLTDEVEQILTKISQLGEAPPLRLQVSLCDMYARAGVEKKTLQALGVLERKTDLLEHGDFERIIIGLLDGGFEKDANRIHKLMEAQGFTPSTSFSINLEAIKSMRGMGFRK